MHSGGCLYQILIKTNEELLAASRLSYIKLQQRLVLKISKQSSLIHCNKGLDLMLMDENVMVMGGANSFKHKIQIFRSIAIVYPPM